MTNLPRVPCVKRLDALLLESRRRWRASAMISGHIRPIDVAPVQLPRLPYWLRGSGGDRRNPRPAADSTRLKARASPTAPPVRRGHGDVPGASLVSMMLMTTFRIGSPRTRALAVLGAVWFPTAVTHSLSTSIFRWVYDTNPLIVLAVAWPLVAVASIGPGPIVALAGALLHAGLWSSLAPAVDHLRTCTEPWPEVPSRIGARMPTRAEGFRELVRRVHELAPDRHDRVLVLPADSASDALRGRGRDAIPTRRARDFS